MLKLPSFILFALFLAGTLALADRDLDFVLEPDFWPAMIRAWSNFLSGGGTAELPLPGPHVYLDGQFIIYGAVEALLRRTVSLSSTGYAMAAAMSVNALSYAVGCTVFARTVALVTQRAWLGVLSAAVLFLSPPMLDISLLRPDFLIFGPLLVVVHCSLCFACGWDRTRHAVALGAALALVATVKINGVMFAAIPVFALVARRRVGRAELQFSALALAVFAPLCAVALFRHLWYLSVFDLWRLLVASAGSVSDWTKLYPANWHYYLADLFLGHGWVFVIGYLAATCTIIGMSVAGPLYHFLALCLVGFIAFGIMAIPYPRGGYHLLPLYILTLAAAYRPLRQGHPAAAWGLAAVLASSLLMSAPHYWGRAAEIAGRAARVDAVKRQPREWLRENADAGTKVCILRHSDWTAPVVEDIGLVKTYGPLDIPYLVTEETAAYPVPDLSGLPQQCPIIALADFHQSFFAGVLAKASPTRAREWEDFYRRLRERFPPRVFSTEAPVGGVGRIEIYDLRPPR